MSAVEPSLVSPEYFLGGCDEGDHSWIFKGSNGYDSFYKCRYCGKECEQ